jgi:hypothetical protein
VIVVLQARGELGPGHGIENLVDDLGNVLGRMMLMLILLLVILLMLLLVGVVNQLLVAWLLLLFYLVVVVLAVLLLEEHFLLLMLLFVNALSLIILWLRPVSSHFHTGTHDKALCRSVAKALLVI